MNIMWQDSALGWLDCLFGLCRVKTKTLAVVHEFTFFTGTSKVSKIFAHYCYTNCLFFPNFSEFWNYGSMVDV